MHDQRGDVSVVGRNLPPALGAIAGANPHQPDGLVAEGFDAVNVEVS